MRITIGQLKRIIREVVEGEMGGMAPPPPQAPRNGSSKVSQDGQKAYVSDQYGNMTVYDLRDGQWVKNRYESSDYQSPEHSMQGVVGRGTGWR